MKRLLVNGSPRGKESNSRLILSWLTQGLAQVGESAPQVLDLARTAEREEHLRAFAEAEEVLLVFPLYTDSMPALVKGFIEAIAGLDPDRLAAKRLAFVVQSGFPEAIHTEAVAAYLARLCTRLGFVHVGTIHKGGIEGIRVMPSAMVRSTRIGFIRAGRELGAQGGFSAALVSKMAGARKLGWAQMLLMRVMIRLGLANYYWNDMLKKHGAFERRFDAPYGQRA